MNCSDNSKLYLHKTSESFIYNLYYPHPSHLLTCCKVLKSMPHFNLLFQPHPISDTNVCVSYVLLPNQLICSQFFESAFEMNSAGQFWYPGSFMRLKSPDGLSGVRWSKVCGSAGDNALYVSHHLWPPRLLQECSSHGLGRGKAQPNHVNLCFVHIYKYSIS